MNRIFVKCGMNRAYAKTVEKNPVTAEIILKNLPLRGRAIQWGEEYYFYTDLEIKEENSQTQMEIGDIAYWPEGKAICIFLGKTPIGGDKPKAISPVNLFAKLEDKIEIKEGEEIIIGID